MHRRDLLGAAAALGLAGPWAFRVRAGVPEPSPRLVPAGGFDEVDDFRLGHALRDGATFPVPAPSEVRDVVIVGGGISGLTALYRLRELDCLLLEKEREPGGNSRRRQHHGIHYPLGALVSQGPVAPFTGFFEELGVDFRPIGDPRLAYAVGGTRVAEPLGPGASELPFGAAERAAFARAGEELGALLDPREGVFFPRAENRPAVRDLDRITLGRHLEERGYPAELRRFLHLMVSSRLGDDGASASAWYGLYLLANLMAPAYTLPGGHGAIAERLAERATTGRPDALRGGVFVTRVQNRPGGGVWVSAVDADGEPFTVAARCAVVAAPKVIARRIVEGLPEARPGLYEQLRYNGFLVAQVALRERVADAFEVAVRDRFTRFVVAADWLPENRSGARGHLTAYVPMPGVAGRHALLGGDPHALAQRVLADLEAVYPGTAALADEVRLHRWGHPMVSPQPGLDPVLERLREPFGDVIFAHSDTFGLAGLYSAVWTGMDAYSEVLLRLEEV